jgi:hypothetical protein
MQRIWIRTRALAAGAAAGATLALVAHAQEFRTSHGDASRAGLPTVSPSTPGGTTPDVYNDAGRAFLRWWDPVLALRQTVDTDEVSIDGTATGLPVASWVAPGAGALGRAEGAVQEDPANPSYRYASTVAQTANTSDPTAGATATYVWTIDNLAAGRDYELSVNLPIGPTDVDPGPAIALRYPQRYFVFRITGVQGGPDDEIIDIFSFGGGEARFGDNGNATSVTYRPTGTTVTVTLYNTAPRGADGSFLDPGANPGNELVYADAVRAVSLADTGAAKVEATPVVAELTQVPPIGGAPQFPRRVYTSRNEDTFVGDLGQFFNFGVTTSFTYNSVDVADPTLTGRRNMVFSWPARRPFDRSDAELQRYAREKRDFVLGPVPGNPAINRSQQRIQVDDLNGAVQFGGTFVVNPGTADNVGTTFLLANAVTGAATANARYEPRLPEADYTVQMWMPATPNGGLANGVQVEVYQGAALARTLTVDQAGKSGWYTIPFQPTNGFAHSEALPLRVVVTNSTNQAGEAGKPVYCDALRFVRKADLGVRSTPVFASTNITGRGVQDALVVAMENGRLYCVDAHGDPATGTAPTVFWTYPTENPAGDPNRTPGFDGKDGVAEMPTGFDLSSALVANVGGEDLLYIASKNGKVYCLEMDGRGDGTTTRRWTYPDDFNPALPDNPMLPGLRPIRGSLAFGTTSGGQPLVLVPTQEGRVVALDAAGSAATRTTTVVWQYPPAAGLPLGPVTTTPAVAFGNVYFCANLDQTSANGAVHCVSLDTGAPVWTDSTAGAAPFNAFEAGPLAVPRAQVDPFDAEDFVYVADGSGWFVAYGAQTGLERWFSVEITSGAVGGSPRFAYTISFDNGGSLVPDIPTVFVVSENGTVTGLHARGQTNVAGTRRVYGYRLDGSDQVAGLATGGWTPGEAHSWMYTGDSTGFVYAFNSNSDTNANPITPGDAPGQEVSVENDPDRGDLDSIIRADRIQLLTPEAYDTLRELADTVGLTLGQITPVVTPGDPQYGVASRRMFEFGETLYILVWDMPERTGNLANYFIEIEVSSAGRASQRRQVPVRPYANIPTNDRYTLVGVPLMTTGSGGVTPGKVEVVLRAVVPGQRGQRSTEVHLPKPPVFPDDPSWDVYLANPLGIAFLDNLANVSNSAGLDNGGGFGSGWQMPTNLGDPRFNLFFANGSVATDQNPGGAPLEPFGFVGPELNAKGDPVAHGTEGVQQLLVYDRSLMRILMGRGLSKVRVGPRDVAWVRDGSATGGVYKPLLANAVSYPGFEDLPVLVPNTSLDYPDVGRDAISMVKSANAATENPLQALGVELAPPVYQDADFLNYRTYNGGNGYDAQLPRTLVRTVFDTRLAVPRYQPPSNAGYYGSQLCYVDTQVGGEQDVNNESYRNFGLGLNVAVDERLTVQTPTVDLGSLPSGGGYNGGVGFGPVNPWDPATAFGPWLAAYADQFQSFSISNDGNVNLLNLRMPKYFADASGVRPVELYAPGLHELSWLDARFHLHSSLDARYSASLRVGGGPGFDPQGRNILQKPRPGDPVGTTFNVNPRSRPNANLQTVGGYLYATSTIPPGEAKVGVSAPFGAPSGTFLRKVFPFENNSGGTDQGVDGPTLDSFEPYSDPGMDLKFVVRETRLTNRPTDKSAPMVESLIAGGEPFAWTNQQPAGLRDGFGNVVVAFSSNRLDAGNAPSWLPKARGEGDATLPDQWRIYLGSVRLDGSQVPPATESPIGDLNAWTPATANRWFRHAAGPLPAEPPANLFDVDTANGEVLDLATVRYGTPAFPSHGVNNPLDPPLGTGKPSGDTLYLAWVGEAAKRDAAGTSQTLSQLMMAPVTVAADGSVSVGATVVAPYDPTSRKSRPSVVQLPSPVSGRFDVAAFTTTTSGALGQLNWYVYNSNSGWRYTGSARLGGAFEAVGAPSATLRRFQNGSTGRYDLTFAAKVRGRSFSEVFLARLAAAQDGMPASGRGGLLPFANRTDELTFDSGAGLYWAPGVQWTSRPGDVDPNGPSFVNLFTLDAAGQYVSVWDGVAATYQYDEAARVVSFSTTFGGKAYIELDTGSVRLSGGLFGRDTRLFARYTPQVMRIAGGTAQNYRQSAHVFDDRFIGVQDFPLNPGRSLLGDLAYWGNQNNLRPLPTDLVRFDRTFVTFSRTSGDGSSPARPFFKTFRFGVQLPTAIALNADGSPSSFAVTAWGGTPLAERFYQLDPATGRVYFMSGAEDQQVRIAYRGLDSAGRPLAGVSVLVLRVGLVPEMEEQAVPIEQVGSDASVSLAMEPMNANFNAANVRRPGLLWMFWSSTRGGVPDIYSQTLAPRFTPRRPAQ